MSLKQLPPYSKSRLLNQITVVKQNRQIAKSYENEKIFNLKYSVLTISKNEKYKTNNLINKWLLFITKIKSFKIHETVNPVSTSKPFSRYKQLRI